MSGVNDELITRLRERAATLDRFGFTETGRRLRAAADALEAAQRRVAWLENQVQLGLEEMADLLEERRTLRAERDAEAALADQLSDGIEAKDALLACYRIGKTPPEALFKRLNRANAARAAHRERRTTPTKDGDQ